MSFPPQPVHRDPVDVFIHQFTILQIGNIRWVPIDLNLQKLIVKEGKGAAGSESPIIRAQEQPMSTSRISERVSEAFIRATGHHDSAQSSESPSGPATERPRPFSVAISREAGTRGPAVARALGARLGWKVYDNELLEMV